MPATRELRRRIKSVKSTKQITKAMELVSSAKVRRASSAVLNNRPYAEALQKVLEDLLMYKSDQLNHPLLKTGPVKKILVIVLSSDRGLAGIYNTAVLKQALQFSKEQTEQGRTVSFICIGSRVQHGLERAKQTIVQSYPQISAQAHRSHIYPIIDSVIPAFKKGEYDAVHLIYTHFYSFLRQDATQETLLPLFLPDGFEARQRSALEPNEFTYEPSADQVLDAILPRMAETQLYQALLESLASEHAARRVAMQNATDNATDVIDDLTLTYNGLRQNAITQEIAEITSGATALSE